MPVAPTIEQACAPLSQLGVDMNGLKFIVDRKRPHMAQVLLDLRIAHRYSIEFALAIHLYTLEKPNIYQLVNSAMYSDDREGPGNELSPQLQACLPYIKFLDTALLQLGDQFHHKGVCYRGVKWVYPNPAMQDPERYFTRHKEFYWYEFKSSSRRVELMDSERFCGRIGPRTIFNIRSQTGYRIDAFSRFGVVEEEVLFRPLTQFRVVSAARYCHPQGGNADSIVLDQLE
eukprot:c20644_g1_i14.p1 GENE.c20644_g1_i14~~c20644_g1_i14.p1  ORF type:complete len:230 (+),score=18.30 c20644_g1_i14:327-1016(+)